MSSRNGIFKWINLIHVGGDYDLHDFGNSGLFTRDKHLKTIEGRFLMKQIVSGIGEPPVYSALNWNGEKIQYLYNRNHPLHPGYFRLLRDLDFGIHQQELRALWENAELYAVINPNNL